MRIGSLFAVPMGMVRAIFEIPNTISLNGVKSWSTDLPGRGLSSPVIVKDSIFLTASSGSSQKILHILAFNAKNGRLRWERKFKATGRTICHDKTCVAASTLASDGQVLIAQFSSNDVFCLDLSGNLKWVRGLAFDHPNIANGLGMSSSPVIAAGTAIIQVENDADSFSFGLDLGFGTTKWKKERPRGANWTSPIILGSKGRELSHCNPNKDSLPWNQKPDRNFVLSRMVPPPFHQVHGRNKVFSSSHPMELPL